MKQIVYVATVVMVLGTAGCLDVMVEKAKNVCGGWCPKKEVARETAESTEQVIVQDQSTDLKPEEFFVKEVSMEYVKNGLETNDNFVLINVLAKKYYDDCHIVGSINIPYDALDQGVEGIDRNAPVVLYCASKTCPVSKKAAQLLQQKGYTNVAEYAGGMKEWFEAGYPYDGPAEESYLKGEKK